MKPVRDPIWLDSKQAAQHVGLSVEAFYAWVKRHAVPEGHVGRMLRFDKHALDAVVRGDWNQRARKVS